MPITGVYTDTGVNTDTLYRSPWMHVHMHFVPISPPAISTNRARPAFSCAVSFWLVRSCRVCFFRFPSLVDPEKHACTSDNQHQCLVQENEWIRRVQCGCSNLDPSQDKGVSCLFCCSCFFAVPKRSRVALLGRIYFCVYFRLCVCLCV